MHFNNWILYSNSFSNKPIWIHISLSIAFSYINIILCSYIYVIVDHTSKCIRYKLKLRLSVIGFDQLDCWSIGSMRQTWKGCQSTKKRNGGQGNEVSKWLIRASKETRLKRRLSQIDIEYQYYIRICNNATTKKTWNKNKYGRAMRKSYGNDEWFDRSKL